MACGGCKAAWSDAGAYGAGWAGACQGDTWISATKLETLDDVGSFGFKLIQESLTKSSSKKAVQGSSSELRVPFFQPYARTNYADAQMLCSCYTIVNKARVGQWDPKETREGETIK